ncbi:MAG: sensor histidine kinase [Acidimicrobiales bacterium]|nr:sensor histidine kinase [Acidimicrobiales bacterium]
MLRGGVASPLDLARRHTRLDEQQLEHLQRLMASWGMLADLSFSDLLLLVPVARERDGQRGHRPEGEEEGKEERATRFVVLGQMRPTTSQTLYHDDLVGAVVGEEDRPLVTRAWRTGAITEGELEVTDDDERSMVQCIPVRHRGTLLAVLTRESSESVGRRPGEMERVYMELFNRFARMVTEGLFPFEADPTPGEDAARVGDGSIVLDDQARITFGSPNAVNALHRMGIRGNTLGRRLDELGVKEGAVAEAFETGAPVMEEIELPPDVIVAERCIPLWESQRITGALLLLRDVSDLRRRDRLLVTKDATIREIHHRVKNNLQTISSLLRLQARRLEGEEASKALGEAERRIRSIALVHDILSREMGEQVDFDQIVVALMRMAEDTVVSEPPVSLSMEGDAGDLSAEVATPLAVAVSELLQNAVEHAFVGRHSDHPGRVWLSLDHDGSWLTVEVRDDGRGLPDGFRIERTTSLGLSIVRALVTDQLGGTIEMANDGGAVVRMRIPERTHP